MPQCPCFRQTCSHAALLSIKRLAWWLPLPPPPPRVVCRSLYTSVQHGSDCLYIGSSRHRDLRNWSLALAPHGVRGQQEKASAREAIQSDEDVFPLVLLWPPRAVPQSAARRHQANLASPPAVRSTRACVRGRAGRVDARVAICQPTRY